MKQIANPYTEAKQGVEKHTLYYTNGFKLKVLHVASSVLGVSLTLFYRRQTKQEMFLKHLFPLPCKYPRKWAETANNKKNLKPNSNLT